MAQGSRFHWVRATFAGVGVTLCVGLLGCESTDKPKTIGTSGTGLPGTPTLANTSSTPYGTTGTTPYGTTGTTPYGTTGTTPYGTTGSTPARPASSLNQTPFPSNAPSYNSTMNPTPGSSFSTPGSTSSTGTYPLGTTNSMAGLGASGLSGSTTPQYGVVPGSAAPTNQTRTPSSGYSGMTTSGGGSVPAIPGAMSPSAANTAWSQQPGSFNYSDGSGPIPPAAPLGAMPK